MKSILISIKPKYVADILNHKKTIEVRKVMPKCDLPIDVYIYCTKGKPLLKCSNKRWYIKDRNFILYDNFCYEADFNGKVVAKFTLNKVEEIKFNDKNIQKKSCLSEDELFDYLFDNTPYQEDMRKGYAWHIDNLVIFDRPRELSEFIQSKRKNYDEPQVQKAPQSWCYVESEE